MNRGRDREFGTISLLGGMLLFNLAFVACRVF